MKQILLHNSISTTLYGYLRQIGLNPVLTSLGSHTSRVSAVKLVKQQSGLPRREKEHVAFWNVANFLDGISQCIVIRVLHGFHAHATDLSETRLSKPGS